MKSPLMLLGVGGAGAKICRSVANAFGEGMRVLSVDTDAASGDGFHEGEFVLMGAKRLAGRGSGREAATVHMAFTDDTTILDESLDGVSVAVIVAALAGGTGGGATGEILKRLHQRGIRTLVFAILPFAFEGEDAVKHAQAAVGPITQYADAAVSLRLDDLVSIAHTDFMKEAFVRATDVVATGITFFWRLMMKPGYLNFDVESFRKMLEDSGPTHFTTATASGLDRVACVLDELSCSPLLKYNDNVPLRRILLGILAGDDLRLSEVDDLVKGIRERFGRDDVKFDLGTVNDEAVFSGRLTVVLYLAEENARHVTSSSGRARRGKRPAGAPDQRAGRFAGVAPTLWEGEDLDVPTYVRRNLTLEH